MTQGGEEGNRDSKILCCYYRMRSASTGLGNETLKEVGKETSQNDQHFPDGKAD